MFVRCKPGVLPLYWVFFFLTLDSVQAVGPMVCVGIEPISYVQHELVNLQLHAGEARPHVGTLSGGGGGNSLLLYTPCSLY